MAMLYENANYKVMLQDITDDGKQVLGYAIVNKKTEVVEIETSVLPTAIQVAKEMSEHLNELNKENIGPVAGQAAH